jgi:hypothetical protein
VLDEVRLFVGVRPLQAQDVDEQALGQQVAALDRLCGLEPGGRERDLLRGVDVDQAVALHAAHRVPDGGRGHAHLLREARGDDRAAGPPHVVDLHQVVLDGR